ncbi:MAG: hypothetical protein LBD48_05275 [Treponema sp.]|jgi:hypothetical protein|nr:hypothetical protein [Treponema sp.]
MLKSKMVFCGVVFFLLLFVLCLAGCPQDSASGPNTEMKSITITEIPSGITLAKCTVRGKITYLFDTAIAVDTAPAYAASKTFELNLAGDQTTRWRGSGDYYVVLYDNSSTPKEYWYTNGNDWTSVDDTRKKCAINSAVKTIAFDKFRQKP